MLVRVAGFRFRVSQYFTPLDFPHTIRVLLHTLCPDLPSSHRSRLLNFHFHFLKMRFRVKLPILGLELTKLHQVVEVQTELVLSRRLQLLLHDDVFANLLL